MNYNPINPYKMTWEGANTLSIEFLQSCYSSMQQRMSDYHEQSTMITERAYKLLSINVTILTLLCAYIYTFKDFAIHLIPSLALTFSICFSIYYLLRIVLPRDYMPLGRTLEQLQVNEYANHFNSEDKSPEIQLRSLLYNEINELEYSIKWQEQNNSHRISLFSKSLYSIIVGLIASAVFFIFCLLV